MVFVAGLVKIYSRDRGTFNQVSLVRLLSCAEMLFGSRNIDEDAIIASQDICDAAERMAKHLRTLASDMRVMLPKEEKQLALWTYFFSVSGA